LSTHTLPKEEESPQKKEPKERRERERERALLPIFVSFHFLDIAIIHHTHIHTHAPHTRYSFPHIDTMVLLKKKIISHPILLFSSLPFAYLPAAISFSINKKTTHTHTRQVSKKN